MLRSTGWLGIVGGVIVAPSCPTCNGSVYDYFVICQDLVSSVAGIARIDDNGTYPHFAARLFLRGDARRKLARRLVRQTRIPGSLPFGPLPKPPNYKDIMPLAVDPDDINDAVLRWREHANREWPSLLGVDIIPREPRFAWRAAVSGPVDQHQGASW